MIAESATPKRNGRVAARVIEGKALLVVIDDRKMHTLNEVATRIWELCDGRSVSAIADAVVSEFEVDKATAIEDVRRFVEELRTLGALELEQAP